MFKLNPNPTFQADVALTVPGAAAPIKVRFTFRHKGRKALADWVRRPADAAKAGEPLDDAGYLGEVIEDWSGPVDEAGQPAAYGREALAALIDAYPASSREIYDGYLRALTESRAKN